MYDLSGRHDLLGRYGLPRKHEFLRRYDLPKKEARWQKRLNSPFRIKGPRRRIFYVTCTAILLFFYLFGMPSLFRHHSTSPAVKLQQEGEWRQQTLHQILPQMDSAQQEISLLGKSES